MKPVAEHIPRPATGEEMGIPTNDEAERKKKVLLTKKQKRVLKQQSTVMAQKFTTLSPGSAIGSENTDTIDSLENDEKELEDLRDSVTDLSEEVSRLKYELNSARLEEFKVPEVAMNLGSELETERDARKLAESELSDLRAMQDSVTTVCPRVADEMTALHHHCQQKQHATPAMAMHAHQAQKERNVLARKRVLLRGAITSTEEQMRLLKEGKGALEEGLNKEEQLQIGRCYDFHQYLANEGRNEVPVSDSLQIALQELTLPQPHLMKLYHKWKTRTTLPASFTKKKSSPDFHHPRSGVERIIPVVLNLFGHDCACSIRPSFCLHIGCIRKHFIYSICYHPRSRVLILILLLLFQVVICYLTLPFEIRNSNLVPSRNEDSYFELGSS